MRTDITTQSDILKSRDGVRARYELRLQSGGETVTTWNSTYHSIGDDPGIPETVVPQDVALIDGVAVSLIADNGTLRIQECFSAAMTTGQTCDLYSRPAIIDYNTSYCQIAWVNSGTIYKAYVNKDQLLNNHTVVVSNITEVGGVPSATYYALHLIAPNEFVVFYIDDGGVRAFLVEYTPPPPGPPPPPDGPPPPPAESALYSSPMYSPIKVYEVAEIADQLALNYTGACRFDGAIYAYFSMHGGSVQAVYMIEGAGIWSDMYEAVAADLSEFKISKASVYNGKVILSGQFNRIDDTGAFDSPYIYGMVLSSSDGNVFAIDRHSLFSFGNEDDSDDGARRFFALGVDAPDSRYGMGGPAFIYYGSGVLGIGKCKYTVAPQQYTATILKLSSLGGSYNDGWMMKAGNMPIDQYNLIKLGDAADIYMAIPDDTGAWTNWFMLQHGVITRKSRSEEDGKITTDFEFEPWGASRLNDMTWPYYVELQGKQSIRDDCDEWDNLYRASEDGFLIAQFYADFFGEATCGPQEAASGGGTTEYTTPDLASTYYLVSNPVIEVSPITIKCYGWSRPGHTVNLETGGGTEPSDPNAENCHVSVRLYLKRGQDSVITTITNLANEAETAHFPRTFQSSAAGYYPVTLTAEVGVDNIQLGDVIEKVGMVFTNPNSGDATLNFPERVEIPEVGMHLYSFEDTWADVTEEISEETGATFYWAGEYDNGTSDRGTVTAESGALGSVQFTVEFFGAEWQNIPTCALVTVTPVFTCDDQWHEFSYDCYGNWPSSGYDTDGDLIPRLEYRTFNQKFRNHVATDMGDYIHVTGEIMLDSEFADGKLRLGWEGNYNARWANNVATIRVGTVRNFTLGFTNYTPEEVITVDEGQELQATGIPVVYFSQKPYYTINCEVAAKWRLVGEDAWGGVVALAKDAQNYICARMSTTDLELVKYRAGIETVLATVSHTHSATYGEWIKLKVRDGHLTVRTRPDRETSWSTVLLEYRWQESDGSLIVEQDISHVGIYAYKNAPFFRTTGFDIAQGSVVGVLPPGEQFANFPTSGTIKIEDCLYTYSGKQEVVGSYMGPYQGRNTGSYSNYSNDGASYSGTAIEFTRFEFLDNDAHKQDYDDYYMAVESGFAWPCSSTDFKPWITTHDIRINLRNRGRYFSPQASGDQVGMSTRVWLTNALTGVARISGADTSHSVGCLVYLNNTTSVRLYEFAASSGHGPLTDKDMIKIVCQLSDAEPRFPGDNEIDTITLSGTPQQVSV